MKNQLVSIVVLTMNHEKYIEQSLLSCINQTYLEKEIILFDNGSSDSTFEIGKSILEKSNIQFRAIKLNKNIGISKALNEAIINYTKGEFICLNSGDDWLNENNILKKINFLNQNTAYRWVFSLGYFYYEDSNKVEITPKEKRKSGNLFNELLKENLIYFHGTIFEKKLIEDMGYFDQSTSIEDWDFSLRTIQNNPIGFIEEPLFFYRRHTKSFSNCNSKLYYKDCLSIISKYASHPDSSTAIEYWKHLYINMLYKEPFNFQNFWYILHATFNNKIYFRTAVSYLLKIIKRNNSPLSQ